MAITQQNNTQTQEQYQELLIRVPLFDDSVWIPLQKKNFELAMNRFYSLLGYYTPKTISQIFWKSIIEGRSEIRGDIKYTEWLESVVPAIAVIILNVSDEKLFEHIYRSLNPATLIYFNSIIISEIPGMSYEEKLAFLKEKKSWLYTYLTGSPINALNGNFIAKDAVLPTSNLLESVAKRVTSLPPGLKYIFFSAETAQQISLICEKEELKIQEIACVSYMVGSVLLGLKNQEELGNSIEKTCNIPKEKAQRVAEEINKGIISPYKKEIISLKEEIESVIKEQEISVPIKTTKEEAGAQPVRITKVEFPSFMEEKEALGPNAPFILHKEKDIAAGAGGTSPFKKGSIFSFGFFKPGGARMEEKKKDVSVKIESAEKTEKKQVVLPSIKKSETPLSLINKSEPAPAPLSVNIEKPTQGKIVPVQSPQQTTEKNPLSAVNIPKPVKVKVQDYTAPAIPLPASPSTAKTAEKTEPQKAVSTPPVEIQKESSKPLSATAPLENKKVHYSIFKTDLPPTSPFSNQSEQSPQTQNKNQDPHVDGNTVFFK